MPSLLRTCRHDCQWGRAAVYCQESALSLETVCFESMILAALFVVPVAITRQTRTRDLQQTQSGKNKRNYSTLRLIKFDLFVWVPLKIGRFPSPTGRTGDVAQNRESPDKTGRLNMSACVCRMVYLRSPLSAI